MNQPQSKLYLGIDPGTHTGFSVWNSSRQKIMQMSTLTFFSTLKELDKYKEFYYDVKVIIEDPNQNRPVFNRGLSMPMNLKVAQNVGMNKRDAQLLIEYCNLIGLKVLTIRPTRGKHNMKSFTQITGWSQRCSQHARDAAMLIYGR